LSLGKSNNSKTPIALAFVGTIAPDDPRFHTAALNPAGQMYQRELLVGLRRAGLAPSTILSVLPVPSRRHVKTGRCNSAQLWMGGQRADIAQGLSIKFLPFINVTPFKQLGIGIGTVFNLVRWGWQNRRAKCRLVYCYNLSVPPGLFILLAARLIRAKTLVSLCDIDIPGETVPVGWYWKLDYWMQRLLIPHFDGHIVVADAIAKDFLNGKPHLRLEGGVRKEVLERIDRKPPATVEDSKKQFVIVAAGHLNEANGLPVLLDAFSLLPGDRFRLRIAGGGPLEAQVRAAAASDHRIEFFGLLSFEQVLEMYASANVLVNVRMTKTQNTRYFFPSKMMEYLASGVPVISTSTGHVEEEFGSFTYLLKEETPKGLSDLIRYVADLDPEARRDTGARARAYMAAHKTWEVQTQRLAVFIRTTLLKLEPSA
jgi:glycosyltransferase involved in cell wall biosynthesis